MPNGRGKPSADGVTSWDFIKQNYRPGDRVAIVIRNRVRNYTLQRLLLAADAAAPRFQSYLRHENATGSDIYISMNTLKPNARGRTKADIATIRHLYLDLDEDGTTKLERILADPSMPKPNYVLDTSPGKHQVIWRVDGFTLESAESSLRSLASQYGGDPAATDATRVLRLPGFHNKKFEQSVRVEGHRLSEAVYSREGFAKLPSLPMLDRRYCTKPGTAGFRTDGRPLTQSERDWAWVKGRLAAGADPNVVRRELAARRQDKPSPDYYATRTVNRAMGR